MAQNIYKRALFVIFQIFVACTCAAMESYQSDDFSKKGHHFSTVKSYRAVLEKVEELLSQGIEPSSILVLSDWDDTINGKDTEAMGAWSAVLDENSVRTEEEVDHQLRDSNVIKIIDDIRDKKIKIIVTTARPPIRDSVAIEIVQQRYGYYLFDSRFAANHPHSPNKVNLNQISHIIADLVGGYNKEALMRQARHKIAVMQERSGVVLTGQEGLKESLFFHAGEQAVVYDDGFAFVGHKKGFSVLELLDKLNINCPYVIVIDDSKKAVDSYYDLLDNFSEKNMKLFFLHYPICN